MSEVCKLNKMFDLRNSFIEQMRELRPGSYPDFPVELSNKASQQFCRDLALRGVEEMFEALQHLKNWKPHRITEVEDFNREEFLEEIVDALNYFFSLLIVAGCDSNQLFEAYERKDKIIRDRLDTGY